MHYQTLGRCWQSDLLATLESCRQSLRLGLARNHLPPGKISAGPILGLQVRHIHVLRDVSSFYLLVDGLLVHEDLRRDERLLGVPGQGGPLQDPQLPTFGGKQLLAAARELCSEHLDGLLVPDVKCWTMPWTRSFTMYTTLSTAWSSTLAACQTRVSGWLGARPSG